MRVICEKNSRCSPLRSAFGTRLSKRNKSAGVTLVLLAALASCGSSNGTSTPEKICGTTMWTGADDVGVTSLNVPATKWTGTIPRRSVIPPRSSVEGGAVVAVVRVSDSCKTGRVVVVTGAAGATVSAVALGTDKEIVGFTLQYTAFGKTIEIRAFEGERQTGELQLRR
jgi:hypothetical protein